MYPLKQKITTKLKIINLNYDFDLFLILPPPCNQTLLTNKTNLHLAHPTNELILIN